MGKRIFRCLLLLALALTSATGYAYDFIVGNLLYTKVDGGVEVAGLNLLSDDLEVVVIPATVSDGTDTYEIQGIGAGAFSDRTQLKSITIPNGVKYIGDRAFRSTSISLPVLPESLVEIGSSAFADCRNMKSTIESPFIIPNNVVSVGANAFAACDGLESVVFGSSVRFIGQTVFNAASLGGKLMSVKSLTFSSIVPPELEGNTGNYAWFRWAYSEGTGNEYNFTTSVKKVIVPQVSYSVYVANGMGGLYTQTFVADSNLPQAPEGHLYIRDNKLNYYLDLSAKTAKLVLGADGITSYDIPEVISYNGENYTVNAIGDQAFKNYSDLASIKIPNTVESIGNYAFNNCSALTSIECDGPSLSIGDFAFTNCWRLTTANIENCVELGESAFNSCTNLEKVNLLKCKEIGTSAFEYCKSLTQVNLGSELKTIGDYAFCDAYKLTELKLYEGLDSIGKKVFVKTGIVDLSIPSTVRTIGEGCFTTCYSLNKVVLPQSLTRVPDELFYNSSLKEVEIPEGITEIGQRAFCSTGLTGSVVIPASVKVIDKNAFEGNNNITSVVFRGHVSAIHEDAFGSLARIQAVYAETLHDWVNTYFANPGSNPLTYAKKLYIGNELLTQLNLSSLATLGSYVFSNCESLLTARIHCGTILSKAFQGCNSLTDVLLDVNTLNKDVFTAKAMNVYVDKQTPPDALAETFVLTEYTSGNLFVPVGTKEVYKASMPCWGKFLDIAEKDMSNLDEIFGDSSGLDEVEVGEEGGVAEWFDLRGVQVDPSNLAPGIYLKRLGSKVSKVIVN